MKDYKEVIKAKDEKACREYLKEAEAQLVEWTRVINENEKNIKETLANMDAVRISLVQVAPSDEEKNQQAFSAAKKEQMKLAAEHEASLQNLKKVLPEGTTKKKAEKVLKELKTK